MKANRHDYGDIFSVCVLYAAHGIFYSNKGFLWEILAVVALLNIQRVHVSAYYRIKSTINHNRKLLQALDDGLKWVSKYINN